ncbi:MAG: hypothetical protein HOM52_03340 [Rhodospirillaceae bacterium]|nr:hypothetical protein [Rhodospirillaceae bacterium]
MMIFRVARGALLVGVLTIAAACGATGPEAERGSRADRVFIMAAEGDSTAQTALGLLYERGIGIARDPALALVWYRRAAEQGDALAEFHIGSLYERGEGIALDYGEAAKWYQRASDKGNESAQAALAYLYDRGLGVERDFAEAEALYSQASASWAEDESFPAEATFATGRESVALANPSLNIPATPLGERRAEFVAGKKEEPAIEIDLAALDDAPEAPPPATIFDGPEPIARRGENFPLASIALTPPEPAHVPGSDEPPGNVPMGAVDVEDSLKPLPSQPKPRPPARVPPPEDLPAVQLQSPGGETASSEGGEEQGLLIAAQPEPERTILLVEDLLDEEAAPAEAPIIEQAEVVTETKVAGPNEAVEVEVAPPVEAPAVEQAEQVAENKVARLDAALDAEATAFDAELAPDTTDADEDILPPLPPEPEIFLISLATYESEAAALEAWQIISTTHAGLLRKLPFEFQPIEAAAADGEDTGKYVELIVGPLDTPLKSRTLCATLRAHGHVCRTIER